MPKPQRTSWAYSLTMILAVAGSAIGFGNLLRFPAVAAQNGGGAFMIPYFICLILLGLPLVWIEWSLGRLAGAHGHGTAPGAFQLLSPQRPWLKYLGIIGLVTPLLIFLYYIYIESWTLAYSVFSLISPEYQNSLGNSEATETFFTHFLFPPNGKIFLSPAWIFCLITFLINFIIIYLGIQKGIEKICKWIIPSILILCIMMLYQIISTNHIQGMPLEWTFWNGLGRMWEPDFKALLNPQTWLAAAGQTFFTLSVGVGVILTYTSYLKQKDDIALSGLTAASINEVIEVIIGGSLLIPAIFMFFGPNANQIIAEKGTFGISFITMPLIAGKMPGSVFFSFIWFLVLFFAGITSTISLLQSLISFFEDEFHWSKKMCVYSIGIFTFICSQFILFFFKYGIVDELDIWAGNLFITLGALAEISLYLIFRGTEKIWDDIHIGSLINIPSIFKFILTFISPLLLIIIIGSWGYSQGLDFILMKNVKSENFPYILATRLAILAIIIFILLLIRFAWYKSTKINCQNKN